MQRLGYAIFKDTGKDQDHQKFSMNGDGWKYSMDVYLCTQSIPPPVLMFADFNLD